MYFKKKDQYRLLPGAILLCLSCAALADDVQDANKLFKQKQYAPALEKVDRTLVAKPNDATARFLKGLILAEQGKNPEALAIFNRLTEDYPELPEPYNNVAVLFAAQGDYEKARHALEMAIRTHPGYALAHENLGDLYIKMASQSYESALKFDKRSTAQNKLTLSRGVLNSNGKPLAPPLAPSLTPAQPATNEQR
ncbi:MAG: tetratricopeptide repeat protein [Pseudomonadota bacterium]